eukprot:3470528-Rhodomonas_salina.3
MVLRGVRATGQSRGRGRAPAAPGELRPRSRSLSARRNQRHAWYKLYCACRRLHLILLHSCCTSLLRAGISLAA